MPAKAAGRGDERHEIAGLRFPFEKPLDGRLGALTLLMRQVHIIEKDDERALWTGLRADIGRVAVTALDRLPGAWRLAARHNRLKELHGLRASVFGECEVRLRQIAHRIAMLVDNHDVDRHELGLGSKRRRLSFLAVARDSSTASEGAGRDEPHRCETDDDHREARDHGINTKRVCELTLAAPLVATARRPYSPGAKISVGNDATYLMRPDSSGSGSWAADRPITLPSRMNSNVRAGTPAPPPG